jgi:hypothetical protein
MWCVDRCIVPSCSKIWKQQVPWRSSYLSTKLYGVIPEYSNCHIHINGEVGEFRSLQFLGNIKSQSIVICSQQTQRALEAPFLSVELNTFVSLKSAANYFRTEVIFPPFPQFPYCILSSRCRLSARYSPALLAYTECSWNRRPYFIYVVYGQKNK